VHGKHNAVAIGIYLIVQRITRISELSTANYADKRICAVPKVGQVVELRGADFVNGPLITRISELSTANYADNRIEYSELRG